MLSIGHKSLQTSRRRHRSNSARAPRFWRPHEISEKSQRFRSFIPVRDRACCRLATDVFFARIAPYATFSHSYIEYNATESFESELFQIKEIKMKKFLSCTAVALALLTTPLVAQAADLPQRAAPSAPVAIPYMYDWTGFYIGANGGYGSNRACWGSFGNGLIPDGCNSKSGGLFGGQGGYRWQLGEVVFGVEAEGDWANLRGSLPSQLLPGGTDSAKVTSVGLFTGQVGYAMNSALLYLKGGGAVANNNFTVQNAAGIGLFSATSHKLGATVGVGLEYGFTPNWSAGIEYDHVMMGSSNNSFSVPAGAAAVGNTISQNIEMVTLRLNYKFGGAAIGHY
jgi:outer membrane immunogenic protein